MSLIGSRIAGIAIPDSALAREATEFVREVSTRLLFDHSRRVYLWASLQAERLGLDRDAELLYVGAMFHDVGDSWAGASAVERLWKAIALSTSASRSTGRTPPAPSSSVMACPRSRS